MINTSNRQGVATTPRIRRAQTPQELSIWCVDQCVDQCVDERAGQRRVQTSGARATLETVYTAPTVKQ